MKDADQFFMQRALDLARRGQGWTSPNPCVGAVLVRAGEIIGEGWHRRAGTPHAEVHAVREAQRRGRKIAGSTLYITLEPCCTHGRTPPCTDLILREKIKRVVVAATDPNPVHAGRAFRLLEQRQVKVAVGILAAEAEALNRAFNFWIVNRRPWVVGKLALSLDGRIAVQPGDNPWLTSRLARRYAQGLRAESDAIIVGAETVRQDDPALTVRLPAFRRKPQPWRVVLTRSGELPTDRQIFTDSHRDRTLIYKKQSLHRVLDDLGSRGVTQALLEGGGRLLGEALDQGLVHEVAFFLAPVIIGSRHAGLVRRPRGRHPEVVAPRYLRLGPDLLCRGLVKIPD